MSTDPASYLTRWSQIDRLHDAAGDETWRWFLDRYRPYLAGVLRRAGAGADEVDGLLEDFWGYLFQSRAIERADRAGRFRSFLAGVVRNFLSSHRRARGREAGTVPIDSDVAAAAVDGVAEAGLWAEQLLHLALERLGRIKPREARAVRAFYGLADELGGPTPQRLGTGALAAELGCTTKALYQLLYRARGLLRECVVREVGVTVGVDDELDDELSTILAALAERAPGLLAVESAGEGR